MYHIEDTININQMNICVNVNVYAFTDMGLNIYAYIDLCAYIYIYAYK